MTEIHLVEVEWSQPPTGDDYYPVLTRCVMCHEDAGEDFRNGVEPRVFYQVHGSDDNGEVVCVGCVDAFLLEMGL